MTHSFPPGRENPKYQSPNPVVSPAGKSHMPGMPTINEAVGVAIGVGIEVGVGVRSTTTRGVYHLQGLLPHPSNSQQPSTFAGSTTSGLGPLFYHYSTALLPLVYNPLV